MVLCDLIKGGSFMDLVFHIWLLLDSPIWQVHKVVFDLEANSAPQFVTISHVV